MIFGAVERALREQLTAERARGDRLEAEVRRLTDMLIELKRDGYAIVPEPILPDPDPLDNQVVEIMHAAGFREDDPTWNHNARYLRAQLEKDPDSDVEQLVEDIKQGDDPSPYLD